MRFNCDNCQASYLIRDDKVGPNGGVVRCKRCQHRIVIRPVAPPLPEPSDPTQVMASLGAEAPSDGADLPPPIGVGEGFDEDLGRAFAAVLSDGTAAQGGPSTEVAGQPALPDDDSGRFPTRVVNLTEMAGLTKPAPVPPEERGAATPSAPPAPVEWFAAIHDKMVGPMDLDGVRGHWERGELSVDSLVWSAGMAGWRALSTVQDLARTLVPARPAESPEGPSAAAVPPALQPGPAAVEWKPSAASALAALVEEELQALEIPKVEPGPFPDPLEPGLIGELPPLAEHSSDETSPDILAAARPDPLPEPAPVHPGLPRIAGSTRSAPRPAAPSGVVLPPPRSRSGNRTAVGAVAGLLVAGGVAAAVVLTLIPVDERSRPPVEQSEVGATGRSPLPVTAPTVSSETLPAPALTASPESVPPPAMASAPVAPPGSPAIPKSERSPAATASAAEPVRAAARVEVSARADAKRPATAKRERTARGERPSAAKASRPPPEPARVAAASPESRTAAVVAPSPPEPAAKAERKSDPLPDPSTARGRSKVDEDFERLFGGKGAAAPVEPPAKPEKAPAKTVYVPPPPGGATRETLSQADVMEVVLANKGEIKRCIEEQKQEDPSLSGTVIMSWSIRGDGTTSGIQTVTPEFQKTPMAACLAAVIKGYKFPPYSGAPMELIKFPFRF